MPALGSFNGQYYILKYFVKLPIYRYCQVSLDVYFSLISRFNQVSTKSHIATTYRLLFIYYISMPILKA